MIEYVLCRAPAAEVCNWGVHGGVPLGAARTGPCIQEPCGCRRRSGGGGPPSADLAQIGHLTSGSDIAGCDRLAGPVRGAFTTAEACCFLRAQGAAESWWTGCVYGMQIHALTGTSSVSHNVGYQREGAVSVEIPCIASGAFSRKRAVVREPACCSGYMDEIRSNRRYLSLKKI